jgi:signal transduction histidine kinase
VGWLRRSGERYAFERFPVAGLGHVYGATPDARGEFWAELGTGRVARVAATAPRPTVEVFGPGEGMTEAWAQVFLVGGEIRVNAHDQILRLDRGRHRFVPDQALVDRFPSLEGALGRPVDDARGRLWITRPDNLVVVDPRSPSTPPSVEAVPEGLRPLYFTPQADGVVWMNEPMRLARYDPALPVPAAPPVRALITRVDLPESGIVLFPVDGRIPNLPAGTGTLGVHYLAAPAPYGRPLDFEVRLSGAEGRWVSTGSAGSVTFNALDPGVYQLRVRPRLGADAGEEARLDFAILAPWYRTRPAYVLYGLSVVGGVGLVIWLGTFFVRREKDRLERLVVRRTGELNRQILETSEKTAALGASEERFRRLNAELEARVAERTAQLGAKVADVERLNAEQQALMRDLRSSQQATDRSAARLQEVNASLMAANQELEAFSYSVSHDLRAPLRNITGFLELLERRTTGRLDAEAARFITVVHTEVARMGLLIDDLLTFSRVGREEMHLQAVALDPLVGEVRAQLAAEVGERAIDWAIGPLPSVRGDPALLRQVFVNLLSNAIKFTRRAPAARIEVGAAVPARGDRTVVIFVRDNGAGFNPKYLGRLFGVFQRLHSARDFEGTGIGLANVKRIVTRHGGRVWAEGQVDQGATFYLKLAAAEP